MFENTTLKALNIRLTKLKSIYETNKTNRRKYGGKYLEPPLRYKYMYNQKELRRLIKKCEKEIKQEQENDIKEMNRRLRMIKEMIEKDKHR